MLPVKQLIITRKLWVFTTVWLGQVVSVVGSQLTCFALGVWVYQRTGSAMKFALISFFAILPSVVLAPVAGALVDRWDRRWMMILGDVGAGLGTLTIWPLLATGRLEIWHIYLATAFISTCSNLQEPAYIAATTLLVPKKHLARASGMNQLGPAVAQIAAPMLAGALLVTIGIQKIILIDLITFLFAVFTMLIVRIPKPEASSNGREQGKEISLLGDVAYGWNYVKARPGLLGLLLFFAVINFTQGIVVVLIDPLVLGFASVSELGIVASIAGCGILVGALVMSTWGGPKRRINGVFGSILLRVVLLFLGGIQPSVALVAVASFLFLFNCQITLSCSQALWQTKVPPGAQGRVFAMRQAVTWVTYPLAYLSAGPLAENVFEPLLAVDGPLAGSVGRIMGTGPGRGIGLLYIVLGCCSLLITAVAYLHPRIRMVEDELPDAGGDDAAAAVEARTRTKKEIKRMKRFRSWLVRIGIALLVILIILGSAGVWFVRRPWPQVSGMIAVPGLSSSVEIIRDQWGVPHIYAQNEHDLFFAQGYVHAQDRLWQMEVTRRICSGTFSEVVGEPTVYLDRFFLTLRLRQMAEQSWTELDGESRAILEAYAAGVNAYVQSRRDRLPLEFTILGVDPEPWTPIDSLTWESMLALNMGLNQELELLQARVVAELGEEAARQLFSPPFEHPPIIVPADVGDYEWMRGVRLDGLAVVDEWIGNLDQSWGSNNWVVHGSRTATGMPILANDVHVDLPIPSIWYENGVHGGRFDSVGFSLPGAPLVVIGHNHRIAWGITNLDPDVQDLYVEKLDDTENPTQYEFMGEWFDLDVIQETINVKGSEPVTFDVLLTRHGPIINDALTFEPSDMEPLALRWTLYEGSQVFHSIVLVNLATNWDEFRTAVQYWDTLSQNFVYADVEGNVGYQAAGRIPIRTPHHTGDLPVPGWTGEYEWQGFIPFDELPSVLNPPTGFIATANNRVISDDYPYQLCNEWFPGYRVRRINDLLTAGDHFTIEDMQDIQAQTYSLPAEALRPYLLAIQPEDDLQVEALAYVEAWDLYFEMDRVGASIYETWYMFMLQNVVGDELGEDLTWRYQQGIRKHVPMMIELMTDPDNAWFDDVNTPEIETRDDIVRRSLADAVNWLSEWYGQDPRRWEWGRLHTATFTHTPLGQSGIAPLDRIFNSRTVPAPGSQFSVNMGWYSWPDQPFSVFHGTAQRMIVDLGNWDNVLAIHTPGQSEHLFHPHREDLISMWQNVEYHIFPFTQEAVEESAETTLTLTPPLQ